MANHVFLSYSRTDLQYVARLADVLTGAGLRVWKDDLNIQVGDRWEHEVRDRVDDCAAMVVVMSPAAEASVHVGNELGRARERGKPFLPVLLSGEPLFALSTVNYFDARGGGLPDQRFLDRLRDLAGGGGGEARLGPVRSLLAGDLPGQAIAWQDRPGLLDALVVASAGGGTAVVAALAGQRGVGKTQLAAAYARLRLQHGWPVIVWANAGSEQGIITALDELAALAELREPGDDPTDAARSALRWLRRHPGPCLLIYDNAVDADLIRAWTPPVGAVQTVVTSTVRALDSLGELIDVSLFTPDEAAAYLARRTRLNDPAGAAELGGELGYLPLALAQAAAIIGGGRRYPTYRKYLQAISGTPTAKLLPRTAGDPYPHGLAEAVLLAIDDLTQAEYGDQARRLLERLAVLAPIGADPILLTTLAQSSPSGPGEDPTADHEQPDDAGDPPRLGDPDELAAILTGRSLTVGVDGDRIVIHRLVQRIVREYCQHAGTLAAAVTAAIGAVSAAADLIGGQWEQRAVLAEYSQHAQVLLAHAPSSVAEPAVWLLARLLYLLNGAHSYSTSLALGPEIIAACERVFGQDHSHTLTSRHNLAHTYQQVGRVEEAIALYTRTLADRERVLGPDHADTLASRHNLAYTYQQVGRVEDAITLHTRTLADRERVLGPDHADTLTSRHNLAYTYQRVGRVEDAITLDTRTLADRERVLGPDHADTLTSRHNLAAAYRQVGRVEEAITLFTRILADSERVLGRDHPATLTSRDNLAITYQQAGRVEEAITLYTRTLADRDRVLGPDHPDTLSSRDHLAGAYQLAGRVEGSFALFTRTLTDRERVLGPDHPDTLTSRHNLAYTYQQAGRVEEAITLYTRTLTAWEQVLGPDHPETLTSRNNLAGAYHQAGRVDDAIALFTRTLADLERVLGPDHPTTVASRHNLACAYRQAARVDKAGAPLRSHRHEPQ